MLTAEEDEEPVIALSSCEAETHALSDTVKTLRNIGFGAEELGIEVKRPISIAVDAAAAISFAQGTAKRQQLQKKDEINYTKATGTDNDADYFTKVHPRPKHQEFESRLMKRLPH